METIKSFSDLSQSRKLAEILPIETADMDYIPVTNLDGEYSITVNVWNNDHVLEEGWVPAWSLAALLDVIPKEVKIKGQRYAPCLFPITDGHWLYRLWYNSNEIIESPIAVWCDNPIDACVEMIIKLKEDNLL